MTQTPLPRPRAEAWVRDDGGLRTYQHSGWRTLLFSWLAPWRERRHAARASRALLALYRRVSRDQPDLPERALQRRIVMLHLGTSEPTAEAVLQKAEENFATWPVRRELNLVDIIHYVAFHTFVGSGKGDHWMHIDMTQTIREFVPPELWPARPREAGGALLFHPGPGLD